MAYAYKECRNMDPRFNHNDWLEGFANKIAEADRDLSAKANDSDKVDAANAWGRTYQTDLKKLEHDKITIQRAKSA
jgi:hypothetical protein